eukprot:gnl/Dysnectes_brevis/674_a743_3714.p1 GENE.gnl/Dysnectes_brevis/674_a743_3714~~gnl/Dysnectes_brevis/674_a743_3714.p1  ORF type:complete len:382 (+),score=115.72 gnl/Dysnectes_brevis/674_a743_3714:94-1239(+)
MSRPRSRRGSGRGSGRSSTRGIGEVLEKRALFLLASYEYLESLQKSIKEDVNAQSIEAQRAAMKLVVAPSLDYYLSSAGGLSLEMNTRISDILDSEIRSRRPKKRPAPTPSVTSTHPPKRQKQASSLAPIVQQQLIFCRTLLTRFMKNKRYLLFHNKVNEEKDHAPRYYSIVKEPMWFKEILRRLDSGEYRHPSQYRKDMILVVENCQKYNRKPHNLHSLAEDLRAEVEEAMTRLPTASPILVDPSLQDEPMEAPRDPASEQRIERLMERLGAHKEQGGTVWDTLVKKLVEITPEKELNLDAMNAEQCDHLDRLLDIADGQRQAESKEAVDAVSTRSTAPLSSHSPLRTEEAPATETPAYTTTGADEVGDMELSDLNLSDL